jgi:hypothetical protein
MPRRRAVEKRQKTDSGVSLTFRNLLIFNVFVGVVRKLY